MKRLLVLTLALALLCGVARAEIPAGLKEPFYSQYGVYSAHKSYDLDDPDSAVPCSASVQSVDAAGNVARITISSRVNRFLPGILSQADWDLDGNGTEEWIVLRMPQEETSYTPSVWLELYGRQGDALVLLTSQKLNPIWSFVCHMDVYLYRMDGAPYLFTYYDELFNGPLLRCAVYSLDKDAIRSVATLRMGADGDTDKFSVFTDDMEANYSYGWINGNNPYESERSAACAAFCERYGLQISSIRPGDAPYPEGLDISPLLGEAYNFAHSAYSVQPKEISQTLLEFYNSWKDDWDEFSLELPTMLVLPLRGQFLVTTGTANLRGAPGLDGEKAGSVPEGSWLRFLHRTQTDDRGVDWYEVDASGSALWISSKFAELR